MNCPNCGTEANHNEAFCRMCGTKIASSNQNYNNNVQSNSLNELYGNTSNQSMSNMSHENIERGNVQNDYNNTRNDDLNINSNTNSNYENNNMNTSFESQNSYNYNNFNNQNNYNNMNNSYNNQTNNSYDSQSNFNNNYNNQVTSNNSSSNFDEELIKAYIGKNADKIINQKFSWCGFFLSSTYLFYRKMWLIGLLILGINFLATTFLPSFSGIVSLALTLFVGLKFKDLYLNHVGEKVEEIKKQYPNASKEELLRRCYEKGGTSILAAILFAFLYGFIVLVVLLALFMTTFLGILGGATLESNNKIEDLSYQVPLGYESSYSGIASKTYESSTSDGYCGISISTTPSTYYATLEEYIGENILDSNQTTKIKPTLVKINGEDWYKISKDDNGSITSYEYYLTKDDETIYEIELQETYGNCQNDFSSFTESLKLD